MTPAVLDPGYDAMLAEAQAAQEAFLLRLFSRWVELGWTIPNMRKNVAEQFTHSGFHPEKPTC